MHKYVLDICYSRVVLIFICGLSLYMKNDRVILSCFILSARAVLGFFSYSQLVINSKASFYICQEIRLM